MTDLNLEELSQIALKIITYAGAAKSDYIKGLNTYKSGDKAGAGKLFQDGEDNYRRSHEFHGDLLTKEAATNSPQISLLLAHAEDQLMNVEMVQLMVQEIVTLYDKIET